MGADIKSVNFIHLSYSWQSKDGACDIYSVYASASYKVASTVIVECRLTYGSSLGAGAENYAFTISSGSTTSSARKCYTFAGDYPGVVSGTGSVRPSEDEPTATPSWSRLLLESGSDTVSLCRVLAGCDGRSVGRKDYSSIRQ